MSQTIKVKIRETSAQPIAKGKIDFDLLDRFGRKIGYSWYIFPVTIRAATDEDQSWYTQSSDMIGDGFRLSYGVTRNDSAYGASNGWEYFKNIAAAEAAVTKKAETARKRYASKPQEER